MDSDELDSANASLFWLDENSFNAECLPIESLDFATFSGDVVPRDGIQRPILVGDDAPRPRAPRAPREQPVHVTHVHQTVIQSTLPVVQAHAATAAEGTSGPSLVSSELSPYAKAQSTSQRQNGGTDPSPKWRAACLHTLKMARFHLGPVCSSRQCSHTRRLTTWT